MQGLTCAMPPRLVARESVLKTLLLNMAVVRALVLTVAWALVLFVGRALSLESFQTTRH